jgi:hypothetical protein
MDRSLANRRPAPHKDIEASVDFVAATDAAAVNDDNAARDEDEEAVRLRPYFEYLPQGDRKKASTPTPLTLPASAENPSIVMPHDIGNLTMLGGHLGQQLQYRHAGRIGEGTIDHRCIIPPPGVERFAVLRSCRGAVMFGDVLAPDERAALLSAVAGTRHFAVCSHGRPSMRLLSLPAQQQNDSGDFLSQTPYHF